MKVGQLAADAEFVISEGGGYFLNGTWGWPSITAADLPSGGPAYPLATPGVSFFMTLPAPLPALDAWDAMLPTAQRLAELLDGQVLDEERNALGRQRIAHIRDQLRGWDRDHEGKEIIFGR